VNTAPIDPDDYIDIYSSPFSCRPYQRVETQTEVSPQQRLVRRDRQQPGQQVGREPRLVDDKGAVDPRPPEVRCVLCQVDRSKPFHDP